MGPLGKVCRVKKKASIFKPRLQPEIKGDHQLIMLVFFVAFVLSLSFENSKKYSAATVLCMHHHVFTIIVRMIGILVFKYPDPPVLENGLGFELGTARRTLGVEGQPVQCSALSEHKRCFDC